MENNENMIHDENSEVKPVQQTDAPKSDGTSKVPFFKKYGTALIAIGVLLVISSVFIIRSKSIKSVDDASSSDSSEIISVNPFDKITVEFSGFDGSGEATVVNENEGILADIKVDLTKSKDLSNGETITASISSDEVAKYPSYEFTGLEKAFTVEGLLLHDATSMVVTDEDYELLKADAQNKLMDYNVTAMGKNSKYDLEFIGSYMINHRDNEHRCGIYYVFGISNIEIDGEPFDGDLYQVVFYNEFAVDTDDTYVFNVDSSNFLGSVEPDLNIICYNDLDDIYSEAIEQFGDAVTYTSKGNVKTEVSEDSTKESVSENSEQ